jgi:hypothetical protein
MTSLQNLIYKTIIDELEVRKSDGSFTGDSHHLAQKLTESLSSKIGSSKKDIAQHYIACYKNVDRWMLITREISTLKHAENKSRAYKNTGFVVKILPLDL